MIQAGFSSLEKLVSAWFWITRQRLGWVWVEIGPFLDFGFGNEDFFCRGVVFFFCTPTSGVTQLDANPTPKRFVLK